MPQIICGILLVVASLIGFGLGTKTIVDGWWAKWGPKPDDGDVTTSAVGTITRLSGDGRTATAGPLAIEALGMRNMLRGTQFTLTFSTDREFEGNSYTVHNENGDYVGVITVFWSTK